MFLDYRLRYIYPKLYTSDTHKAEKKKESGTEQNAKVMLRPLNLSIDLFSGGTEAWGNAVFPHRFQ